MITTDYADLFNHDPGEGYRFDAEIRMPLQAPQGMEGLNMLAADGSQLIPSLMEAILYLDQTPKRLELRNRTTGGQITIALQDVRIRTKAAIHIGESLTNPHGHNLWNWSRMESQVRWEPVEKPEPGQPYTYLQHHGWMVLVDSLKDKEQFLAEVKDTGFPVEDYEQLVQRAGAFIQPQEI